MNKRYYAVAALTALLGMGTTQVRAAGTPLDTCIASFNNSDQSENTIRNGIQDCEHKFGEDLLSKVATVCHQITMKRYSDSGITGGSGFADSFQACINEKLDKIYMSVQ